MWLFLAFLVVPLIEIALFIQIGGVIGLGWTLLIVVATAVLGAALVRAQGLATLGKLQSSINEYGDPTEPLVHGAMILFAGALLLTPGFFTDVVGFSLLVPQVRQAVFVWLRARVQVQSFGTPPHPGARRGSHDDDVIDVDYREVEIKTRNEPGSSGWTKH